LVVHTHHRLRKALAYVHSYGCFSVTKRENRCSLLSEGFIERDIYLRWRGLIHFFLIVENIISLKEAKFWTTNNCRIHKYGLIPACVLGNNKNELKVSE